MDNKTNDKKTKAVVLANETTPENLLAIAVKKGASVEQLEKLMDLQERWQKQVSQKAFLEAMSKFQADCPELKKTKRVKYTTKSGQTIDYGYAPLSSIAKQIKLPLKECGLSYRWESEEKESKIHITCVASHLEGHSEKATMSAGKDTSGGKNEIQQISSSHTYMQRYTLIEVFGITTADEDVDGQVDEKTFTDLKKKIIEKLKPTKNKSELIKLNSKYPQFQKIEEYQKLFKDKLAEIEENQAFDKAQKEEFIKQTIEDVKSPDELKIVLKENGDIMNNETLKKLYNKKLNSFKDGK